MPLIHICTYIGYETSREDFLRPCWAHVFSLTDAQNHCYFTVINRALDASRAAQNFPHCDSPFSPLLMDSRALLRIRLEWLKAGTLKAGPTLRSIRDSTDQHMSPGSRNTEKNVQRQQSYGVWRGATYLKPCCVGHDVATMPPWAHLQFAGGP